MTRRDALTLMATICGGTIFGAPRMLGALAHAIGGAAFFTPEDRVLLNEIAETIVPATPGSGGAKAADVAAFIDEIVRDFYDDKERALFTAGLARVQSDSRARFSGRRFEALEPAEREALLLGYEPPNATPAFYSMLKQLTLWGYFSSEVGAKQALAYLPVPGRYEGCITIDPAKTKAWFE